MSNPFILKGENIMATNTTNKNVTEDEEIRPITITDNESGNAYILEFNAESVKFAESRGFDIDDVPKYPVSKVPELFYYAFRMHHKMLPKDKVDKIYDSILPLPEGMLARMQLLYLAPLKSMFTSDGEAERKNTRMTVQF